MHQILIGITFFKDFSDLTLFYRITLKLGRQLDHEEVQRIFYGGYDTPIFYKVITLFKEYFQTSFCFRITPTVFIRSG